MDPCRAPLVGDASVPQLPGALESTRKDVFSGCHDETALFERPDHLGEIHKLLIFLAIADTRTVAKVDLTEDVVEVEDRVAAGSENDVVLPEDQR